MRPFAFLTSVALLSRAAFPQPAERPKFEAADVHTSPQTINRFMRGGALHGAHYEIRNASMVDLVRAAYSVEPDKVLGGPTWVEMDRFDVFAQTEPKSSPESLKLMLQSLLADRFKLVAVVESRPMPAFTLKAGPHPQVKQADGTGQTGCQMSIQNLPSGPTDGPAAPVLAFACHNITMEAFAEQVRSLPQARPQGTSPRPVMDQTGLKGAWDFGFKYDLPMGPAPAGLPIAEALDKQLGLKLEAATIPLPVVVIKSVNRTPTPNSPEAMTRFPALPDEFEVAEIKPSKPDEGSSMPMAVMAGGAMKVAKKGRGGVPQLQNGRVNLQGYTFKSLVTLAWDVLSDDAVVGWQKWMDTDRFDVIAKVPAGPAADAFTDTDSVKPLLRKLLLEKFQMKVHNEEKVVPVYVLTSVKPKLKKADPADRTRYLEGPAPDTKDPRTANPALGRLVTCQNMTLKQFASLLPTIGTGYVRGEVIDDTGIAGAWEFTLNFSPPGLFLGGGGRGGGDPSAASEPSGALSLFDAISKQLGLKLDQQKRSAPVLVIDHADPKPIE